MFQAQIGGALLENMLYYAIGGLAFYFWGGVGAALAATVRRGGLLISLIALPLYAHLAEEPFTITLATRAVILSLAAVGLNIALGIGGLVSLGHAVFFGIGGYAMGILAFHAQNYMPLMEAPFLIEGTKSMPMIWLVAVIASALSSLTTVVLS